MKTNNLKQPDMRYFCANLKMLRTIYNINQEDIAHDIYLSRSTYSDYENGKKIPDLQTIDALSAYFNIEFDSLINQDLTNGLFNRAYAEPNNSDLSDILNKYQSLSTSSKHLIMERVETLIERESAFYKEYLGTKIPKK